MSIFKWGLVCVVPLLIDPFAVPWFGQALLDDVTVASAIQAGTTGKNTPFASQCFAKSWAMGNNGTARVVTTTTPGYIALLADLGRKLYRPITVADIGPDLRKPMIHVIIGDVRNMGVKQVILKSKSSPEAFIAPEQVADGSNLSELDLLQRGTLGGLFARFSYEGFRKLPSGEIQVVILNDQLREVRCDIGRSDRAKLIPGG